MYNYPIPLISTMITENSLSLLSAWDKTEISPHLFSSTVAKIVFVSLYKILSSTKSPMILKLFEILLCNSCFSDGGLKTVWFVLEQYFGLYICF